MESETNKEIREVLEMFGISTSEVKGEWNLIGHLKNVADNHAEREYKRRSKNFNHLTH